MTLAGYYGGYYSRRYYRDDDDEDYGWRRYRHAGARWLFNDEYEGSSYRDYGHSCRYWRHRCAESWGWGNSDYYGCTRYHGCD
ncbi:hypothetical protein [Rhodomicrobium vannielii]|uniref:hypothetical protein n=1 Tax=Rhodomicrobium vannielii TaxID=1069 RepID=UPI001AECE7FB|nr:hypothetical protein [Rhodomicrobium vannielii]